MKSRPSLAGANRLDSYERLALAIARQAAIDYRSAKSSKKQQEIERFILSDWFFELTGVDGMVVMERLWKD